MAPRKEKTEKTSADQGAAMVFEYLQKQNRPYSVSFTFVLLNEDGVIDSAKATDVSSNLHNKVTKTQTAKYLKEMHERKEIEGKAAGKQVVYHSLQNDPVSSAEDLAELETTMNNLREEVATAKATEKTLKNELLTLSSVASAEDLRSTIEALKAQKEGLLARLNGLKKVEVKPVSEQEKVAVEEAQKLWKKHAKARKGIVRELWYKVLEALPEGMTKEEFWESLGCEGMMP